jgi:acetyl-CoA synthetase
MTKGLEVSNYNIGYLCTDWQVEQGRGEKIALKWISASQDLSEISFRNLSYLSNKAANVLLNHGLVQDDRMMILLPKIPELYEYFLGALKAGINCCILFSSIGEDTLSERILDTGIKLIVTNNSFYFRIQRILPRIGNNLKVLLIDENSQSNDVCGVCNEFSNASNEFTAIIPDNEQVSNFHFTSGSTGKPKGVQHIHVAVGNHIASFNEVMQPDDNDIYWCTADPGWVTGVTYGINAPWINGITQIQVEGNYNPEIWMGVIEKYKVSILYTAPTVFRMLMQKNNDFFSQYNFSSLKKIYCVGEPLNPAIINWGRQLFKCEIYDTWFQTETGSIMISNRPGMEVRPGSMGKPLSYITASILNESGQTLPTNKQGLLCIKKPWSSMFTEYINNLSVYQNKFIGDFYNSGDIAYKDQDGYFWFIGRNDDVINTAGHLVSPFEVESALMELPNLIDVAVVGIPDSILFEKVVVFAVLQEPVSNIKALEMEIKLHIANKVSSIASPKEVVFVTKIPKTKSGKIMRRILKKQYLKEDIGDLSTMEED